MNEYTVRSAMEADWAIEKASSPCLRAMFHLVGEQVVQQVWEQGYLKGACSAFQRAAEMSENK